MNSQEICDWVYNWACGRQDFTAPYGVLAGEHTTRFGTPYKSVTFGRARTLDATVEIYNRNFIVVRTSTWGSQTFRSFQDLETYLQTI